MRPGTGATTTKTFLLGLLLLLASGPAGAADADRLLYHAELEDGTVVASRGADTLVNPASVVKVGTSLWALERLGADHRYVTTVGFRGSWKPDEGTLDGDLVVAGGGDPDLHAENVFLVARALDGLGLREVTGDLVVTGTLWCGWENGTVHRIDDPVRRAAVMGGRFRNALDPARWDRTSRASWEAMCRRRGWDPEQPPRVRVAGGVRWAQAVDSTPLVHHRSNPLVVLLRRFNVFSNNDILRVADGLGGVDALETFLHRTLRVDSTGLELSTASGESRNRMTPRQAVGLLRALQAELAEQGLELADVLPVIGCDPGPTRRMFPLLGRPERAGSVVCKTGTLTTTDGGVAVLAGVFTSPGRGEVLFCAAAPRAGGRLQHWRQLEQGWLLDLMSRTGGAVVRPCGGELPYSDTAAEVAPAVPPGGGVG